MSKVRADNYSNRLGTGAPDFPDGLRVTGTAATFSGNVSIAGTLTYQDVESIDSIGIITAQQGVQVLANGLDITGFSTFKTGVSVTGVVTATSFSGSGANLTGIDAAPSFTGIASGSLTNGQAVVLTDDGKITGVTTTVAIGTSEVGPPTHWYIEGTTEDIASGYDSFNDRIVHAFRAGGNADTGAAVVGEVNGKTAKYGQYVTFHDDNTLDPSITFDSNSNKIIIAYAEQSDSSKGKCYVGTVNPDLNTITFGDKAIFNNGSTAYTEATFDSTNNKVVIAYRDEGNSNYGTAVVGTVSGTSISFGSETVFESADTRYISATFDSSNNKVVIAYVDHANSEYGTAVVGTVSGTSISFGTPVVFESAATVFVSATFDSTNNKVVIAYKDNGNSEYGTAIVGTVSGTSISFGTPVVFASANTQDISAVYDSNNDKVIIAHKDAADGSHLKTIVGTVSGTSISFGGRTLLDNGSNSDVSSVYVPTFEKTVVTSRSNGAGSDNGVSRTFDVNTKTSTLTHENFLGFSNAAYSDGDSAKIQLVGSIDDAQSGLTTGRKYYVHIDGSLGTTPDSPSVSAGLAITDTKLYVR